MSDFYLVWNPDGTNPRFRHSTRTGALTEAQRLAAATPGQDFYVLHAVSVSRVKDPVETVSLTDDGLPFPYGYGKTPEAAIEELLEALDPAAQNREAA